MDDAISDRLKACIAVEKTAAEIYRNFSGLFPEARALWDGLAMEEENHAAVLIVSKRFLRDGKLPGEVVPPVMGPVQASLELAADISRNIRTRNPSLREALDMALELERSVAENYFLEAMESKNPSGVMAVLQHMVRETNSHVEKIHRFMQQAGI
jgi:rubrerythrin